MTVTASGLRGKLWAVNLRKSTAESPIDPTIDPGIRKLAPISDRQLDAIDRGVAANERLTAVNGALLLLLLAAMGVTVLSVRRLLPEHYVLGFVLIPPLALKAATTGYRFGRYYTGASTYRSAGPPV
jgi:hypothetical protein